MNRLIVLAGTILACALTARAEAAETERSLLDVIKGRIVLSDSVPGQEAPSGVNVKAPANCQVQVKRENGKIVAVPDGSIETCPTLWKAADPRPLDISFKVGATTFDVKVIWLDPPADTSVTRRNGQVVATNDVAADASLYVFTDSTKDRPWLTATRTKTGFVFSEQDQKTLPKRELAYYLDDGRGALSSGTLEAESTDQERKGTRQPTSPPTPPAEFCEAPYEGSSGFTRVICVDFLDPTETPKVSFRDGTGHLARKGRGGHVIPPNHDVLVRVRHDRKATVRISMEGTRGLVAPGTLNLTNAQEEAKTQAGEGAESAPEVAVTFQPFAPRQPGSADVTIRLSQQGQEDTVQTIELIVDQTYSGAVRLGIGLPFLGAKDAEYDVATLDGSAQPEIVSKTFGGVDLELVVGYSAYLDKGGRSLTRSGCRPWCWSPFVGVGVWAPEATGVEFLKSLYVGAELEPAPNFSLSLNAVARRVSRLREGYHVGSAVSGTEVPTQKGIGVGLALVATFSPDFLRLARPAAGSFFE